MYKKIVDFYDLKILNNRLKRSYAVNEIRFHKPDNKHLLKINIFLKLKKFKILKTVVIENIDPIAKVYRFILFLAYSGLKQMKVVNFLSILKLWPSL